MIRRVCVVISTLSFYLSKAGSAWLLCKHLDTVPCHIQFPSSLFQLGSSDRRLPLKDLHCHPGGKGKKRKKMKKGFKWMFFSNLMRNTYGTGIFLRLTCAEETVDNSTWRRCSVFYFALGVRPNFNCHLLQNRWLWPAFFWGK